MNSVIEEYFPMFEMYQSLRNQMMTILNDSDLDYTLGGDNKSLGALCVEIGEIEHSYIHSFKAFDQNFSYKNDEPGLEGSVARLTAWFQELDQELRNTIESLTQEDISIRVIERGPEFKVPPHIQLEIYKEALLIFYGKSSVYLKALGKELPQQWQDWIA
jgi:uncharacterized damage-inducible protein DinB